MQGPRRRRVRMQGNLLEKLGPNSSILREYLGDRRIVLTLLVWLERYRSGVSFLSFYVHKSFLSPCFCVSILMFLVWLQVKELHPPLDGILMASILI
jgi:hypothetical protein